MRPNQILTISVVALLLLVTSLFTSCSELRTNLPPATSNSLQVHDDNWGNNPGSSSFHGAYLKSTGWQINECKACHGSTYTGGTSGKSCFKCHSSYPHADGFAKGAGHGTYLYNLNYPFAMCQACHGANYAGGAIANVTCMRSGCHADAANVPRSPESCNTCHGDFTASAGNLLASAPPRSVTGETATTVRGVGAHQKHVLTNTVGVVVKCQECHTVPTQLSSSGHLGALPAEVVFNDQLSRLPTGGGTLVPKPSYDPSTLKCNNSYCHGNWRLRKVTASSNAQVLYTDSVMVGANYSPVWTNSADGSCGSCHGIPPKGHLVVSISACGTCHFGIVSSEGKIIDKAQHINGKVNVFGQEYSF